MIIYSSLKVKIIGSFLQQKFYFYYSMTTPNFGKEIIFAVALIF